MSGVFPIIALNGVLPSSKRDDPAFLDFTSQDYLQQKSHNWDGTLLAFIFL
jgi:hypothetical protein